MASQYPARDARQARQETRKQETRDTRDTRRHKRGTHTQEKEAREATANTKGMKQNGRARRDVSLARLSPLLALTFWAFWLNVSRSLYCSLSLWVGDLSPLSRRVRHGHNWGLGEPGSAFCAQRKKDMRRGSREPRKKGPSTTCSIAFLHLLCTLRTDRRLTSSLFSTRTHSVSPSRCAWQQWQVQVGPPVHQ